MESVGNAASSVSRAIFGSGNESTDQSRRTGNPTTGSELTSDQHGRRQNVILNQGSSNTAAPYRSSTGNEHTATTTYDTGRGELSSDALPSYSAGEGLAKSSIGHDTKSHGVGETGYGNSGIAGDHIHGNSSNAYGSGTRDGPHRSDMANVADPRVDSDRDHRAGTGYGTSNNYSSTNNGPHSSNFENKLDPRVDSDRDHRAGATSTGNNNYSSINNGPHSSNVENKLDPRVDSDRDHRDRTAGNTSTHHHQGMAATGAGVAGAGLASASRREHDGPHCTEVGNQMDPRVDSARDHRSRNLPGSFPGEETTQDNRNANFGGVDSRRGDNISSSHNNNNINQPMTKSGLGQSSTTTNAPREPNSLSGVGSGPGTAVEPSVGAHPSSGQRTIQKQQGADRPMEDPAYQSPVGGARGRRGSLVESHPDQVGVDKTNKSGAKLPSGPGTGEGTGEIWIRSTGMAAEGGDFDAARAGAGREADRLLEEKGIHRDHGAAGAAVSEKLGKKGDKRSDGRNSRPSSSGSSTSTSERKGLGEKIKEKLHIGGH